MINKNPVISFRSTNKLFAKKVAAEMPDLGEDITIILIAHRLKTVQKCHKIFFIDNGKVVDHGTYDELIEKNEQFKNMSMHA